MGDEGSWVERCFMGRAKPIGEKKEEGGKSYEFMSVGRVCQVEG